MIAQLVSGVAAIGFAGPAPISSIIHRLPEQYVLTTESGVPSATNLESPLVMATNLETDATMLSSLTDQALALGYAKDDIHQGSHPILNER